MSIKIQVKNLNKSFNNVLVLKDINLNIVEGDSIAIIGGSGSGKSVLVKCIVGLFNADSGSSILINDFECANLVVSIRPKSVREAIGMLFQGNALFDSLTVAENITFVLYNRISKSGYLSKEKRIFLQNTAKEYLDMVELSSNNLKKYPYELSGGMQKRVAIARVISTKPEIILLDEPTTGLDPLTSYNISSLLSSIKNRINATMIAITHDPICVSEVAKNVILIDNRTIAWNGELHKIATINNPYVETFKKYVAK